MEKRIADLVSGFRQSLEDERVSRGERKLLRSLLKETLLTNKDLAILRRSVFEMAKEATILNPDVSILEWLEDASKLIYETQRSEAQSSSYFSPGDDCLNAILHELRAAKKSIDICVFTVTDDRITRVLLEAYRRGIAVRVLTDNDKSEDRGSDIEKLADAGVAVRTDRTEHHMHHKFALFDGQRLLTGSYNWTRSAALSNQENLIILRDSKAILAYQSEFERLWSKMARYS